MAIQDSLEEAIRKADRAAAAALLEAWAAEHGYERLLAEVLEPTLLRVGEAWNDSGSFTIAQMYVAGKIAADALERIVAHRSQFPAAPARGVVAVGNIEDDFHSLGRKLLATFLRTDGWTVRDLGNDVEAPRFVDEALASGARVLGVSAMMLTTARNISKVRAEIDRRGLTGRLQLAVGGAVFLVRPGLVAEVGGDGTAPNALGASALFVRLAERAAAAGSLP
jgi:methanogenic corrinoid protein MtbC1